MKHFYLGVVVLVCLMGMGCKHLPQDKSAFAAQAGQSTIVAGACETSFNIGWPQCLVEKGSKMPTLRFVTTNASDWAVSDCAMGLYKTGSTSKADLVEIDLSGLQAQAEKFGICFLKIETQEYYPDPNDSKQRRKIYMRGGLVMEVVDPGYFPTPSNEVLAFCVKVARTTKGRTRIENCTN